MAVACRAIAGSEAVTDQPTQVVARRIVRQCFTLGASVCYRKLSVNNKAELTQRMADTGD